MLKEATGLNPIEPAHAIRMTPHVLKQYKESIGSNEPETFALLGGSIVDDPFLITDFYFLPPKTDASDRYVASGAYIYPDHRMLNYIVDRVLVPNGRYMIGLWHSHPGQLNTPSHQDLAYCSEILANDDSPGRHWSHFLAPITTFDRHGHDSVTGWVLPRNGAAFKPAAVVTPVGKDKQAGIDHAAQKDGVHQQESGPRERPMPNSQTASIDTEFLELSETVEANHEVGMEALTYIEKYHIRRKLAEVRLKINRYA